MAPKMPMTQSPKPVMVTLYGKRDSADMIKLRILRQGNYPGLSRCTLNVIARMLMKGGKKVKEGSKRCKTRPEESSVSQEGACCSQSLRCRLGAACGNPVSMRMLCFLQSTAAEPVNDVTHLWKLQKHIFMAPIHHNLIILILHKKNIAQRA